MTREGVYVLQLQTIYTWLFFKAYSGINPPFRCDCFEGRNGSDESISLEV